MLSQFGVKTGAIMKDGIVINGSVDWFKKLWTSRKLKQKDDNFSLTIIDLFMKCQIC